MNSNFVSDPVSEILGEHGPIAAKLKGFSVRLQQQEMADAIQQAIEQQSDMLIEAGTGTGKTFAYLLPAICSGRKVIISTGTKTLQDQLFNRDLPF
jgi:ATP-dependent DNA helicase DinG